MDLFLPSFMLVVKNGFLIIIYFIPVLFVSRSTDGIS